MTTGDTFVSITKDGKLMTLAQIERAVIALAIEHHKDNLSAVAKSLGVGRTTLYRKMKEMGL